MTFSPNAAIVYEDGPTGSPYYPSKPEIRTLLTSYETVMNAFTTGGGLVFTALATMTAAATSYTEPRLAWLFDGASSGVYALNPTTDVWTKVGRLPYDFVIGTDLGAGTANAIQITTDIPVADGMIVAFSLFEDTTSSPVMLAINGAAGITLKTNRGDNASALTADMEIWGRYRASDSTFRMLNDQDVSALVAVAVAAAETAVAAVSSVQTELDSRAYAVASYHPTVAPNKIRTAGYAAAGDGGGALYKSNGTTSGDLVIVLSDAVTSAGYNYVPQNGVWKARAFGVTADGATDDLTAATAFATKINAQVVETNDNPYAIGMTVEWGGGTIALSDTLVFSPPESALIKGGAFKAIGAGWATTDPLVSVIGTNFHAKFSDWYDINIDCSGLCSGLLVDGAGRFRVHNPKSHRHMSFGYKNINARECWVINPQIAQWTTEHDTAEYDDPTAYTADGVYVGFTDTKIVGGEISRNKCNLRLANGSGVTNVYGTHIYNQSIGTTGSGTTDDLFNVVSNMSTTDEATFHGCYIDNAAIEIYAPGDRVTFISPTILFNDPLGAYVPTFITVFAGAGISFCRVDLSDVKIIGFPAADVVFIDWVSYGGNVWSQDFTKIKSRIAGVLASSNGAALFSVRPATQELCTFKRNGAVRHYVSSEANAYVAFMDINTADATNAPKIGATGDNLILQAPASAAYIQSDHRHRFANLVRLPVYTKVALLALTSVAVGDFAGCSNGGASSGYVLAYYDGTNWRRHTDSAVIS